MPRRKRIALGTGPIVESAPAQPANGQPSVGDGIRDI